MGREKLLPRQAQPPLARCFPSFPPQIRSTIMPSPRKVDPLSLLGLPAELHAEIIDHLSFPDNANLKRTCRYFRDLVTFGHAEQIEAESSPCAIDNRLYACVGCLRLRSCGKFADNMIKAKRRRRGPDAEKRFCVECGTAPLKERFIQGYAPGAIIIIRRVKHAICVECEQFGRVMPDSRDRYTCLPCRTAIEEAHEEEAGFWQA